MPFGCATERVHCGRRASDGALTLEQAVAGQRCVEHVGVGQVEHDAGDDAIAQKALGGNNRHRGRIDLMGASLLAGAHIGSKAQ